MDARQEFEKWYLTVDPSAHFRIDEDGDYETVWIQTAWRSWQAATAHLEAKTKELREALEVIANNPYNSYGAVQLAKETLARAALKDNAVKEGK